MITVITGPMFGGKSKKLIEIYNSIEDKSQLMAFKPSKDTREFSYIKSRDYDTKIKSIVINKFEDIYEYINEDTSIILIDEVQFVTGKYNVIQNLSIYRNIDFYISGLNQTSEQEPFGSMPNILAFADNIELVRGRCSCGKEARYTIYDKPKTEEILIGSKGYRCVCRECLTKED